MPPKETQCFLTLHRALPKIRLGTSLMVQGLRICLAVQGTWVQSFVRELRSHMLLQLSPCTLTTEPTCFGARAPQLESLCTTTNNPT